MASVVHTSDGSFIPASQRPDGTWRKQRRVKDGYTPQEEVPLYESRGKQWAKNQVNYIPGLDPELLKAKAPASPQETKKKKNKGGVTHVDLQEAAPLETRRIDTDGAGLLRSEEKWETVKPRGAKEAKQKKDNLSQKEESAGKKKPSQKEPAQKEPAQEQGEAVEPAKRLRNLKKKLKEIKALEDKINSKELKNPDKDQLNKVSRKDEIEAAILALELEVSLGLK